MKELSVYIPRLKDSITVPSPETLEEAVKLLETQWLLFSDMLAENVPFYYFIHTIISTVRDLDNGLMKVMGSKVCMLPLIRTALENTLMCYGAYLLKDSTKLDTFTKRYLEGRKVSLISISLPPEKYNQIKHPDKPEVTTNTEVELTNANLSKLMDLSFSGVRNIYLECCGNIHPTKEQIQYYIRSIGYVGEMDGKGYREAELSPEDVDKYTGWMIAINDALLALLNLWLWCYHHIPFNPDNNGTKEIVDMVNAEIPLPKQSPEEIIDGLEKILANTSDSMLKEALQKVLEAQYNKLNNSK